MEFVAVVIMIVVGIALAIFFVLAVAVSRADDAGTRTRDNPRDRDSLAASLLYQVLIAGGVSSADALRDIRRVAGAGRVTMSIDVANWASTYAKTSTRAQCEWLLETAVQLAVKRNRLFTVRQYAALLDLSFSLGFQTDALARLRDKHGFEYVDHAKEGRPREADRAGVTTFFSRDTRDSAALLRTLEIEGQPTRQLIIAAYRRLVAQHHPDRVHDASEEIQSRAAAKFIELTRAYEALLTVYRD